MGTSRPTIAAPQSDTNRGYKKTSHRVSMEAVRNALLETRREASAVALPLLSAVQLETSHISIDDRFAAQIVYSTGRNAPAPKASGWLSAQHELRSSRKGPRPPMSRLVDCCGSFHFGLYLTMS